MKDYSFSRFFNPQKSPRTQINPVTGVYLYYPKHEREKHRGKVVWDSSKKGTYIRSKHGELYCK